jgi:hypothetical protein
MSGAAMHRFLTVSFLALISVSASGSIRPAQAGLNHRDDDKTLVDVSAIYNMGDAVSITGEEWLVGISCDYNHAPDETTNSIALQVKAELEENKPLN